MNPHLKFDFTVNKQTNSIEVTREFAADLDMVWAAWTTPELLDQWWAPKPYQTRTKYMNFTVGGYWLYAMIGPNNETHWCSADYKSIDPKKSFSGLDAFCNEEGEINTDFPRSLWNNSFNSVSAERTEVNIRISYETLADLEKIVELGFKEGFTMALGNLDQYLEAQFKLRLQNKTSSQPRVSTYLNFAGNTEEAMLFYKQAFRGEFTGKGIQRFGDLPENPGQPPMSESLKKMVLHVELPIFGGHILMATDAPKEMGFTVSKGNNMHIQLEPETREEAKRLFDELSVGGTVEMPMQDMFWGGYFGSFCDKYGINWMIHNTTLK